MPEEKTLRMLSNIKDAMHVCKHIFKVEDISLGFNVPEDINNDCEAWCDECEKVFLEEGKWTKKALKFAGFRLYCPLCFLLLREDYIEKK